MNDSIATPKNEDWQLDRLDELLSLYFDDCLSAEQIEELNAILLADSSARERTFEAAQLHADLHAFFQRDAKPIASALPVVPGLATLDQPVG